MAASWFLAEALMGHTPEPCSDANPGSGSVHINNASACRQISADLTVRVPITPSIRRLVAPEGLVPLSCRSRAASCCRCDVGVTGLFVVGEGIVLHHRPIVCYGSLARLFHTRGLGGVPDCLPGLYLVDLGCFEVINTRVVGWHF